ncbi:MAG: methyltransferase [Deltaproteobacteria bacterium]|nr:methyltransferase [Deltaproteobacteria bacterium]
MISGIIKPELKFLQPETGYRINIDTVILYGFVLPVAEGNVLEIGSACGALTIMISKKPDTVFAAGVEINKELYELSLKNQELNESKNKTVFINADINDYKRIFKPQSFDMVVVNPPFYASGTGRVSKNETMAIAHHDQTLGLEDIVKASLYLLKPKGYLAMLFLTQRIGNVFLQLRGFKPGILRFVHRKQTKPSDVFLLLAKKTGSKPLKVLPPLIVHDNNNYYTEEMKQLLGLIQ